MEETELDHVFAHLLDESEEFGPLLEFLRVDTVEHVEGGLKDPQYLNECQNGVALVDAEHLHLHACIGGLSLPLWQLPRRCENLWLLRLFSGKRLLGERLDQH